MDNKHRSEQYRFEGYVYWENRKSWVPESDWQLEYKKRGKMLWVGRIEWGKASQLASQRVCTGETIRKIIWKLGHKQHNTCAIYQLYEYF